MTEWKGLENVLKEAIKEAATIEEATQAAALELGVPVERMQVEILQQPQKKTFGLFGGCPARVRGYVEETAATTAAAYLKDILFAMGFEKVDIEIKEEEKGCQLSLSGDEFGSIIGRRGETLDALQYLTGLVANRVDNSYYRVTIDVGNYREKREEALQELARRIGNQASKTGRRTSLEPMNPYERRIIHTTVQSIEGATSWSVGSEPNRHVVIGPSDDNPNKDKASRSSGGRGKSGGRGGRGGQGGKFRGEQGERSERPERGERPARPERGRRPDVAPERPPRQVREFIPRSNPLPTADGATPPSKTQSEKESSATLYGRIDL